MRYKLRWYISVCTEVVAVFLFKFRTHFQHLAIRSIYNWCPLPKKSKQYIFSWGVFKEAVGWFFFLDAVFCTVLLFFNACLKVKGRKVESSQKRRQSKAKAILSKSCRQLSLYLLLSFPQSFPRLSLSLLFRFSLLLLLSCLTTSHLSEREEWKMLQLKHMLLYRRQKWLLRFVHRGCVEKLPALACKQESEKKASQCMGLMNGLLGNQQHLIHFT